MNAALAPAVATSASFPASAVSTSVIVASLVIAVVMAVLAFLDRSAPLWSLGLVLLLEVGLVVLAVMSVVAWVGGNTPAEPVVFVFYLLACLAIPPVMLWWGRGEPGRWGTGVVAIACLLFAVLMLRLQQVWTGGI